MSEDVSVIDTLFNPLFPSSRNACPGFPDDELVVVEGVTKLGSGTEADDYMVKAGCYRFQVSEYLQHP